MKQITSLQNEQIKAYAKLLQKKYRDQSEFFLVEGKHLVAEAAKYNYLVTTLSSSSQTKGLWVTEAIINKLSNTKTPQSIIGVCKKKTLSIKGNKVLVLDNLQDPGNVGTLIRTAKAFKWDGIIIQGVDIYNPKVIRASQGAIFALPILQVNDLKKTLNNLNLPLVGALLDKKALKPEALKINKLALILGNEGQGISKDIENILDYKVYIPIAFESLNVAIAGAILMYQF